MNSPTLYIKTVQAIPSSTLQSLLSCSRNLNDHPISVPPAVLLYYPRIGKTIAMIRDTTICNEGSVLVDGPPKGEM